MREWDRNLFMKKKIYISDSDLESCFDPWHRESRAYERLDSLVKGPFRSLFPEYYGTTKIPYASCPISWKVSNLDHGEVCIVVLELLEGPSAPLTHNVILSDQSLAMARKLYLEGNDCECVHMFTHTCEMVDILHRAKIIHGDLKPDNLLDHDSAGKPVLLDFSRSWTYVEDLPCLDMFKRQPRKLKERRLGELGDIKYMVISYAAPIFPS
jgi:serine/threonine protein kinase